MTRKHSIAYRMRTALATGMTVSLLATGIVAAPQLGAVAVAAPPIGGTVARNSANWVGNIGFKINIDGKTIQAGQAKPIGDTSTLPTGFENVYFSVTQGGETLTGKDFTNTHGEWTSGPGYSLTYNLPKPKPGATGTIAAHNYPETYYFVGLKQGGGNATKKFSGDMPQISPELMFVKKATLDRGPKAVDTFIPNREPSYANENRLYMDDKIVMEHLYANAGFIAEVFDQAGNLVFSQKEGAQVTPGDIKDVFVASTGDNKDKISVDIDKNARPNTYRVQIYQKMADGELVKVGQPVAFYIPGPKWNNGETTPNTSITIPRTPDSATVPEGAVVEVDGPGIAKITPDGELKVTPQNTTGGETITVTVKDKYGVELDQAIVTVKQPEPAPQSTPEPAPEVPLPPAGSSESCIAAGLGFGLPLLAIVPLALASTIHIPGLAQAHARIDQQIKEVNTRLQQQAGIFNEPLARFVEQLNAQLASPQVRQALGVAGILAYGLTAGLVVANECAPGGLGSSTATPQA